MRSLFVLSIVFVALSGCSPITDVRGNVSAYEKVEKVQPGLHTKQDVERILGTPSLTGSFNNNSWYYIGKTTETKAFFKPETIEAHTIAVDFDTQERVKSVRLLDAQGIEIDPSEHKTVVRGHNTGFFEQFFGSFGRFAKRQRADT